MSPLIHSTVYKKVYYKWTTGYKPVQNKVQILWPDKILKQILEIKSVCLIYQESLQEKKKVSSLEG